MSIPQGACVTKKKRVRPLEEIRPFFDSFRLLLNDVDRLFAFRALFDIELNLLAFF